MAPPSLSHGLYGGLPSGLPPGALDASEGIEVPRFLGDALSPMMCKEDPPEAEDSGTRPGKCGDRVTRILRLQETESRVDSEAKARGMTRRKWGSRAPVLRGAGARASLGLTAGGDGQTAGIGELDPSGRTDLPMGRTGPEHQRPLWEPVLA